MPRTNRARGLEPSPDSLRATDGGRYDHGLAVDGMYWFCEPPPKESEPRPPDGAEP